MSSLVVLHLAATVLTLDGALLEARRQQPEQRRAVAVTAAAVARQGVARAPLLPQITLGLGWQRTTANFVFRPGAVPTNLMTSGGVSLDSFNFFNLNLGLSQTLFDWAAIQRFQLAAAQAEAQGSSEQASARDLVLRVSSAYYAARAGRALVEVARETLASQERHLSQIQVFVEVGRRPAIDLAQARAERANARLQLLRAGNDDAVARAQLARALGREGPMDYEVADSPPPPVAGEERSADELLPEALAARPELRALARQERAAELQVAAQRGGFMPTVAAQASVTGNGAALDRLGWNASLGLNLSWPLFQGLQTVGQVREAEANRAAVVADRDRQQQDVLLELRQALLTVGANREGLAAADEALRYAGERLRLAEGRYEAGVGSAIELGDAQLALTAAAAQRIQAEFALASARAQLVHALGRE